MGGSLSRGADNDDLTNILKVHGYMSSKNVERVFRAVDRGDYTLPSQRDLAYKDMSLKVGNIHLSAPCVYCKVMEGLSLQPGQSFLNIGSGTGYLNTMAGLILGESGINHGIEMHGDCLEYAYEHLEEFKQKSLDVDVFEFCEPVFKHGNFLNAIPNRQYDRVYCGAACPETHEKFVKQFVKIGGILVMPYKDHLLKIRRISLYTWSNCTMLPVSFAPLITPQTEADRCLLQLPLYKPHTLQELCRSSIRRRLRKIVWSEHNDLEEAVLIKVVPVQRSTSVIRPGLRIPLDDSASQVGENIIPWPFSVLMDSGLDAVLEGACEPLSRIQVEQTANETSDESDDNEEFDIDHVLLRTLTGEETEPVRETDTQENSSETRNNRMEEDNPKDVDMDIVQEESDTCTKETEDIETKECEQGGSHHQFTRSSGPSMKRKSAQRESDDNSRESERNTRARETNSENADNTSDMSDIDGSDYLNFLLFKKVYSMHKVKNEVGENSGRGSPSSSEEEDKAENDRRIAMSTSTSTNLASPQREETRNDPVRTEMDQNSFTPKLDSPIDREQQRGSSKCEKSCDDENDDVDASSDSGTNSTSAESLSEDEFSDSSASINSLQSVDSDIFKMMNSIHRRPMRPIFAYNIRKDLFSGFMRKMIEQLPLPPPLRIYVNYNREL